MNQSDKFKKIPDSNYVRLPNLEYDETSKERLLFLRKFIAFVFTSGIIQEVQIRYIQFNGTLEELKNDIDSEQDVQEHKTLHWYRGKMAYDNKRLRNFFTDSDMVEKVARFMPDNSKQPYSLSQYFDELQNAQRKFQPKQMILSQQVIDLRTKKVEKDIQDNEFDAVISVLKPYSRVIIEKVGESIPDKVKAYLNYLCLTSNTLLSEKDLERYEILRKVVSGDDIEDTMFYSDILNSSQEDTDFEIDLDTFKEK